LESTELIEVLADALAVAWHELESLSGTPWPFPDKVVSELEQRDALVATLASLPDDVKRGLHETYRAALAKATRTAELEVPVDREVLAEIEAAYEIARRQSLFDPELRDAIRRLSP
jgi:hypothetical protein